MPYSTYALNTSFLSKKGFSALLRDIKAPVSTM